MGPNLARGPVVAKSARFPVLGTLLAELAIVANLGFRVVQRGDRLVFETYAVTDRTAEVRLDVYNNTLAGHRVAISPPGATRVIVAGQGDLEDRTFLHLSTAQALAAEAQWGRRIERFVDQRNTDDRAELTQAGMEVLTDEGFTSLAVQAVPMEDTAMDFGTHWNVGDRVAVVVDGQELASTVTGYVLKTDSEGFRLGALIGDPVGFDPNAAVNKRLQRTENRVSALERHVKDGTGGGEQPPPPGPGDDVLDSAPLEHGQWYRIAEFMAPEGTENAAAAEFTISDGHVMRDDFLRLRASIAFGHRACSLILQEYSAWIEGDRRPVLSLARIVNPIAQGSNGVHWLEVWGEATHAVPARLRVRHEEWTNGVRWTPVNFAPVDEQPGLDDLAVQRGVAPTGTWTAADFQNGWSNFGHGYTPAGYRMLPGSTVELRGLIAGGTIDRPVFSLPVGMRPAYRLLLPTFSSSNNACRLDVTADGLVIPVTGQNGWLTLDGVCFLAEQ
jgi:hypothetical protein